MLGFHESVVDEVGQQDGLVVMAAGLGMHKVCGHVSDGSSSRSFGLKLRLVCKSPSSLICPTFDIY
jgi:hypothetical protein